MKTISLKKFNQEIYSTVFIGLLVFPFLMVFPLNASAKDLKTGPQSNLDIPMSKDVYFKVYGPVSGPPAPKLTKGDYPKFNLPSPFDESRIIIWTLAQQHRYFAAFFLGGLFWIMVLELAGLLIRDEKISHQYKELAYDLLGIVMMVYSMTAIMGVLFLFGLIALYPDFTEYLVGMFRPFFMVYALFFLILSFVLYVYYYSWKRMHTGFLKWSHASLGIWVNVLGISMMMIANSWGTFMMSPAGVDTQGQFLGNIWAVLHNALWNPINVHRFFGNLIFSAAVIGAYSAFYAIKCQNQEERSYYNWLGYLSLIGVVFSLFTFPFGGYWLLREVYAYRQQMGITLLGGIMAWLGIIRGFLISILFLGINTYIWQKIGSAEGGRQYRHHAKYVFLFLAVCFLAYVTPHTLVMKAAELEAIGGQQHPIVGNYGVESTKNAAINTIIIVTIWSLLMWWRSNYKMEKLYPSKGDGMFVGLFLVGVINVVWLGIYGYYIPANVRVGLSVPQALTTLSVLVFGSIFTYFRISQAKKITSPVRESPSVRGFYILFAVAVTVTWAMALGGYIRSSVRLFWHGLEIFRDASPGAFTHTIGFAGNVISMNVLLFWFFLFMIIWIKKMGDKQMEKEKVIADDTQVVQ